MEETVTATEITTANIFEQAAETMGGFMTMTGDFFTGLWANPMGKIIITLGLVSGGIGLCYRLFLRRKHVQLNRWEEESSLFILWRKYVKKNINLYRVGGV